jgi:hypothetical protein
MGTKTPRTGEEEQKPHPPQSPFFIATESRQHISSGQKRKKKTQKTCLRLF